MIKKLFSVFLFIFLIFSTECSKDCSRDEKCFLEPETGPCDAAFIRYYFDQEEGKCKEFTWGGCDGVVPFETLEECENDCGCNN